MYEGEILVMKGIETVPFNKKTLEQAIIFDLQEKVLESQK
jgi:hypothetical protein